jgi:hypothetical protein
MIQVLISPNSIGTHMRAGDIVCAGLAGTPWTKMERLSMWLAEWEDDALEAELLATQRGDGGRRAEAWPVIGSPYRDDPDKPARGVPALPQVRWVSQLDANGQLLKDTGGEPLPPTRLEQPATAQDYANLQATTLAVKASLQASRPSRLGAAGAQHVEGASRPVFNLPPLPDLTAETSGPPLRSRILVDLSFRTAWTSGTGGSDGDIIHLADLDGHITFDAAAVDRPTVKAGKDQMVAAVAAAAARGPSGVTAQGPTGTASAPAEGGH